MAYDLARAILGDDFISPEDIMKSRKSVVYTDDQLSEFWRTVPSQKVLEWCRDNGYMLIAGPSRPLSLREVRSLKKDHFYRKKRGWYAKQAFAQSDKADTRWIMLRKEPVPQSTLKNRNEQQALLSDDEVTPNVAEVVWCVTTFKAVRDTYLFSSFFVRTSSLGSVGISSVGNRVIAGIFGAEGLRVSYCWDDDRNGFIGVSVARKR